MFRVMMDDDGDINLPMLGELTKLLETSAARKI